MSTPAEELRDAAKALRDTAAKATRGPWVFFQTITRNDLDEDMAWTVCRPVCEKANGSECDPDCGADVLQTGAEGCEHDYIAQGDVVWMTLVHPGLAEPFADMLEHIADDMSDDQAVEREHIHTDGTTFRLVHPTSPSLDLGPRFDWTAALRTARQINGTAS